MVYLDFKIDTKAKLALDYWKEEFWRNASRWGFS